MQTSLIDLPVRFGDLDFPRPAIFIDAADGLIDIWMNIAYQDWMVAKAGQTYGQNLELIRQTASTYRQQLSDLQDMWSRPSQAVGELKASLVKMREALANLHTLFYVITCEESLQAARDEGMQIRSEDQFFVDAEKYIQASLCNLLPHHLDLISHVTMADLEAGLDPAILEERCAKFLFVDGQPLGLISLHEYIQTRPVIVLQDHANEQEGWREIKGQIAQMGLARGRVKIVRKKDQVAQVEVGDVIVSPMTTPDFLPAMKKAVAFVTDEGGITCHAAIVARELGKPCIIGTKIASKVFKDGDMVEVDANQGIVRKL